MVLCIGGNPLKRHDNVLDNLDNFLQKYEKIFRKQNDWLKKQTVQCIAPSNSCLYVSQRELASTGPFDEVVKAIGSDMMTTCHIAVLRCKQTKATSLAHFDGCSTAEGVREMIDSVEKISRQTTNEMTTIAASERSFDLHIVGGFEDERRLSEELSMELLKEFDSLQVEFCNSLQINLQTFCCTTLNQEIICKNDFPIKSPVLFGLGVVMATGELFPAVFNEDARAPVFPLRGAKSLHGPPKIMNIYKWETRQVVIEPFTYKPFPTVSLWLQQTDEIIRRHMSTSPEVEPENFEDHIRQSLGFIESNRDPLKSIFQGNKPLLFRKEDESWVKVE